MSVFDFGMTDLEEQFNGKGGSEVKKRTAESLSEKSDRLREIMKGGLPQTEFKKAENVLRALEAARSIVERFPIKSR